MSTFWNWYITILALANIFACFALLRWTSKRRDDKTEEVETTGHVWDDDLEELNNPLPRWWLMLFYITIIFGLAYLALYPGLGNYKGLWNWTQTAAYEKELATAKAKYAGVYKQFEGKNIQTLATDSLALKYGQRLFVNNCAVCHGSDAQGAKGFPNLTDNDWLWGGEPEIIRASIVNGRQGVMPPWEAALGKSGVEATVAYVLSLSGHQFNDALVSEGKQHFSMYCVACHGADAKGNKLLGAPNLTDNVWLYGHTANDIRTTISQGRNGAMPAHQQLLDEDKINLLVAYVFSLSNQSR